MTGLVARDRMPAASWCGSARAARIVAVLACAVAAAACSSATSKDATGAGAGSAGVADGAAAAAAADGGARAASLAAWNVVYGVLLHPRCVNCHPAGDRPLTGEQGQPHPQNVQRGPAGLGVYAQRCAACHQTSNLAGPHMPPGAPSWHLPSPSMPLVFEGRSSGDLCRQLLDPGGNGRRTPEEVYGHLARDPLVLWGWNPGEGREPVPTPHDVLVAAVRTWIDTGCGCPDR